MKELKTYEIKCPYEFYNIIIEEKDCFDIYMGCKGHADLMYMFGIPKETYTLESIKLVIKNNTIEYLKNYIENYIEE